MLRYELQQFALYACCPMCTLLCHSSVCSQIWLLTDGLDVEVEQALGFPEIQHVLYRSRLSILGIPSE
jgi:hypothetical protein